MGLCRNCNEEFYSWDVEKGTLFYYFCSEKCAKEHEDMLQNQDWPREPALKYKVPVGEIACPECGTVQHGVLNPICVFCDKPYWKAEEFDINNAPWLFDVEKKE